MPARSNVLASTKMRICGPAPPIALRAELNTANKLLLLIRSMAAVHEPRRMVIRPRGRGIFSSTPFTFPGTAVPS